MHRLARTGLHAATVALLLLSLTGVPLRVHVCHTLGSATLFSSCGMHEGARHGAEGPALDAQHRACCAEHELLRPVDDPFARCIAHIAPEATAFAAALPGSAISAPARPASAYDDGAPPGRAVSRAAPLPLRI